jgi:phage tail-like protein
MYHPGRKFRRATVSNLSISFPGSNFIVDLSTKSVGTAAKVFAGFQEASGLPSKVEGVHVVGDVTLNRGVIDSESLEQWINAARTDAPTAKRNVSITQRDVSDATITTWKLINVTPKSFNGPTLGHGTGDLAIEELVLSAERIDLVMPPPGPSR